MRRCSPDRTGCSSRMGRHWYTAATYARGGRADWQRRCRFSDSVRTSSPVFPGETDGGPCRDAGVRRRSCRSRISHVFPYSARPGTAADAAARPRASGRRPSAGPASCARLARAKAAAYAPHRAGRTGRRHRAGRSATSRQGLTGDYLTVRPQPTPALPRGTRFDGATRASRLDRLLALPHRAMTDPRPTVYVETYGCQMNVSDSELMLGSLAAHGYDAVDAPRRRGRHSRQHVRDSRARGDRVIGRLGELRRNMKRGAIVGVTGCMAQRLGPILLERAKHVSIVDRTGRISRAARAHRRCAPRRASRRDDVRPRGALRGFHAAPLRQGQGVDPGATRLRLPMHLLHRADHPRVRAEPPARRRRAGDGIDGRARE